MYEFKWVPENVKYVDDNGKEQEIESAFEGSVLLNAPDNITRMEYIKRTSKSYNEDNSSFDMSTEFIKIAESNIKKVDLKRKEDGLKFTSLEDMKYDVEASNLLITIGARLVRGFSLGKDLKKKSKGKSS